MSQTPMTQAEQELKPYLAVIAEVISTAHTEQRENSYKGQALTAGTKASMLRDFIVYNLESRFFNDSAVKVIKRRGLTSFLINNHYNIRIKKLDKKLRSRNVLTQQALAFMNQLPMKGFEDDCKHLNAGYVLDKHSVDIIRIAVTCPDGRNLSWAIDLIPYLENNTSKLFVEQPKEFIANVRLRKGSEKKQANG